MVLLEKQHSWGDDGQSVSVYTFTSTTTHLLVKELYAPACGCCNDEREIEIPLPKEGLREALLGMLKKLDE